MGCSGEALVNAATKSLTGARLQEQGKRGLGLYWENERQRERESERERVREVAKYSDPTDSADPEHTHAHGPNLRGAYIHVNQILQPLQLGILLWCTTKAGGFKNTRKIYRYTVRAARSGLQEREKICDPRWKEISCSRRDYTPLSASVHLR